MQEMAYFSLWEQREKSGCSDSKQQCDEKRMDSEQRNSV